MWNLLRQHERYVRDALAAEPPPDRLRALRDHHAQMIRFMQHERLIHLVVMLFVGVFLLLTAGFALVHPHLGAAALAVIFLGMTAAYLVHASYVAMVLSKSPFPSVQFMGTGNIFLPR